MKKYTISVVGGDFRNIHLANCLAKDGHTVFALFFEKDAVFDKSVKKTSSLEDSLAVSDIVVLPIPVTIDNKTVNTPLSFTGISLSNCFCYIKPTALVVGGMVTEEVQQKAKENGIFVVDYLKREEMAVYNAMLTAEGAIELALNELPTAIFGQKCLVLGYGRIAKALTRLLLAFGADVTVAARKHRDLAWARVFGAKAKPITQLKTEELDYQLIYNTIPVVILDRDILSKLSKDCLVIDLASKPGGVEFEVAKELSIKTIWALSIPGKTAPLTAGEIIKNTIVNIIEEREAE